MVLDGNQVKDAKGKWCINEHLTICGIPEINRTPYRQRDNYYAGQHGGRMGGVKGGGGELDHLATSQRPSEYVLPDPLYIRKRERTTNEQKRWIAQAKTFFFIIHVLFIHVLYCLRPPVFQFFRGI